MRDCFAKARFETAPSLKELALEAYAQYLHNNVPKEDLSYAEMVAWGDRRGLGNFFDLNLSSPLTNTSAATYPWATSIRYSATSIEKSGFN